MSPALPSLVALRYNVSKPKFSALGAASRLILCLLQLAPQQAHLNMNDWKRGAVSENHGDNEREQGGEAFFPPQRLLMLSKGPFEITGVGREAEAGPLPAGFTALRTGGLPGRPAAAPHSQQPPAPAVSRPSWSSPVPCFLVRHHWKKTKRNKQQNLKISILYYGF